MTDRPNTTSELSQSLRSTITRSAPSPSRGEMGTPITRCDNPLCECNRAASIAPGTRTVPCGCGRLLREDETENNEWSFVAPGTEEGATEWTAQDEAHLQHLSECHEPAWMGEVATRTLAALRSSRRREEETGRDAITARCSAIDVKPPESPADVRITFNVPFDVWHRSAGWHTLGEMARLVPSRSSLEGSQQ